MSIATDLQAKLKDNQRTIYITDADDLLAAWRFKRKSSSKRSKNLSIVPTEWRCSAPHHDKNPLKPCHISYQHKAGQSFGGVKPAFEHSTTACHHTHGADAVTPLHGLDGLDAITIAKGKAQYVSPLFDLATLALVCKDLGISGKAIPKVINGRQYIAFSGYAGLRNRFPGTLYAANNRKVIRMAIGSLGIKSMVRNGGIITFCITVPLTILEAFLKDHTSCYALLGNLTSDLLKIGIPALMGYIAGLFAGGFTLIVFWQIAAAISVSVFVGYRLNLLDDKYQLTAKLCITLEKLGKLIQEKEEQMQKSISRAPHTIERGIIWHTLGADIDHLLP